MILSCSSSRLRRPILFQQVLIVLVLTTNLIQKQNYHHHGVVVDAFSTSSITPTFLPHSSLPHLSSSSSSSSPYPSQKNTPLKTQLLNTNGHYDGSKGGEAGEEEPPLPQDENRQTRQEDVSNLFATYMAQRKDKGFSDMNYNPTTSGDANDDDSGGTNSGNNDWNGGMGAMGTTATSSSTEDGGAGGSGDGGETQRRRLGSKIPGLRRFLSTPDNEEDSKKVVQHIPLSPEGTTESKSKENQKVSIDESTTKPPNPPSLLEQDLLRIDTNYQKFYTQMKNQLEELRSKNPDSIPENANEILGQVIEEQKAYDMKEVKNQRALESFDEYYERRMREKLAEVLPLTNDDTGDISGNSSSNNSVESGGGASIYNQDPIVKEIVEEATKEQQFRIEQEEQYRKYKEYEDSLRKKLTSDNSNDNVNTGEILDAAATSSTMNEIDFDEMQLQSLQNLLERRQKRSESSDFDDEDLYVTDNIEDGIEELREKIENKESYANIYKPESIKDWQMYRAIATKLANAKMNEDLDEDDEIFNFLDTKGSSSQGRILLDTITKDDADVVRRKIEAWKEFQVKEEEMRKQAGLAINYRPPFEWSDKPEPDEESQLRQKPKKPFDLEKAEEARSELDQLALQVLNDLMMKTTDAARRQKILNEIEALKEGIEARRIAIEKRGPIVEQKKTVVPIDINSALGRGRERSSKKKDKKIDFSQDVNEQTDETGKVKNIDEDITSQNEDDYEYDYLIEPDSNDEEERPDSQFFRDLEEDMDLTTSSIPDVPAAAEEEEIDINLGTMEEQKFRSMVARSGIRNAEEQNKLKQDWEDFQRVEQMMREKTGLSGTGKIDESTLETKYDVNNIFKDGDIDADAILGTIGKRPSRKNRGKQKSTSNLNTEVDSSNQVGEIQPELLSVDSDRQKNVESTASDNMLDTTNNGQKEINNDPEIVSTEQTPQKEFVPERGSLTFGQEFISKSLSSFDERKSDLLEYSVISVAQLNTLMALKQSVYSTGVSPYLARVNKPFKDFGAIFMLEGVLVDLTGLQYEAWKRTARTYDFPVPTLEDTKYASVHAEDYAVQKIFFWTDDIFALRKVVETYKEKRYEVFQELVEGKNESPFEIGLSSPELNQESSSDVIDVENDVLNVQTMAWQKTAKDFGFEAPTIDLVKVVGSLAPDEAVRAVFKWSSDFIMSNNVAASYRKYLKEETSKWMSSKPQAIGSTPTASMIKTDSNAPKILSTSSSPTMEDYLQLKLRAWETVAQSHNFDPPSLNQVNIAEFAGPEKAVENIFKWTSLDDECQAIVTSYRNALKVLTQEWIGKTGNEVNQPVLSSEDEIEPIPLISLREGTINWLSSLEEVSVPSAVISNMDDELMNGILEEAGLSEFFSPDKRIGSSNSYTTDTQKMLGAALRVERRPDHCIVFSATPQSAFDGHEVEMKNIALVSPYPYYELTTADMTVRDFKSIGMMNLKNVFSETRIEEPMQQVQAESPRYGRKTMLKTRFWDD